MISFLETPYFRASCPNRIGLIALGSKTNQTFENAQTVRKGCSIYYFGPVDELYLH
jgi:hypothetical protein